MLNNKTPTHSNTSKTYTWNGIIEFLQDHVRQNMIKQNEWLLERQQITSKLAKVEGELAAQEMINQDLMKRVKMLEFCLRKERYPIKMVQKTRIKYSNLLNNKNIEVPELKESLYNTSMLQSNSVLNQISHQTVPKRRAKGHRHMLLKFLEEIGYDDIFSKNDDNPHNRTIVYNKENMGDDNFKSVYDPDKSESSFVLEQPSKKANIKPTDKSLEIKEATSVVAPKEKGDWKKILTLQAHFDGVRDLFMFHHDGILCSVSEDCMVKVWNLNTIKNRGETLSHLDPYLNFREHTGPLFSLTGLQKDHTTNHEHNLLYTAGSEGIIRAWKIPTQAQAEENIGQGYCFSSWVAHEEPIWELQHHPFKNFLVSLSGDGFIKLWDTSLTQKDSEPRLKKQLSLTLNDSSYHIPTSITWVHTNLHQLICGFSTSNTLLLLDQETMMTQGSLKFSSVNGLEVSQPNKIITHPHMNLLMSAHEDALIRLFDLNSNKLIQTLSGHQDSVTGLSYINSTGNLVSVSHDGSLKIWDLRKYSCSTTLENLHMPKYDEVIHSVLTEENTQHIFTGGADGTINIFDKI